MSKIVYTEDDMLMLSGIQHYCFCPRQWYLIHIEQLWKDNALTMEGNWLHKKVHQPEMTTKRRDKITLRSIPLASPTLGLYGFSDAVELTAASETKREVSPTPIIQEIGVLHLSNTREDALKHIMQTDCSFVRKLLPSKTFIIPISLKDSYTTEKPNIVRLYFLIHLCEMKP